MDGADDPLPISPSLNSGDTLPFVSVINNEFGQTFGSFKLSRPGARVLAPYSAQTRFQNN